jgi:hypothetical protein
MLILAELQVARVRVLFSLPSFFGWFPHPLAYVHWYRPLTQLDPATTMYQVLPSTRQGRPNSEVISVDRILQACHLAPNFGSDQVPVSWLNGDTLNYSPKFYLNKYFNFHLFDIYENEVDM